MKINDIAVTEQDTIEELKEGMIQFKNLLPETRAISDQAFHLFCEQFNNFEGFYVMEKMFDEQKLTETQRHFLVSLFFFLTPTRESPEKNEQLKEMVKQTFKNLGYQKAELNDKDFNRKIYQYVMLSWKGI